MTQDERDHQEEAYWSDFCPSCNESPCCESEECNSYYEWVNQYPCPLCGITQIKTVEAMPSMMSGYDHSLKLACGHTITFDPFTGKDIAN